MAYTFILEDLAGNARSELAGARDKRFTRAILTMGTGGFTLPLWHDQADFVLQGDALLKVVDVSDEDGSRTTVFHGRLVTAEEVAGPEGGSVQATFADGFWSLLRRLCGRSTSGYSRGTALAPVTAASTISDLVNTANAEAPLGLRLGTVVAGAANTYTGPVYFKPIGEVIAELSAVLDGPDWRVEPIDAIASTNPSVAYYSELTVQPAIGQTRLDQPFEYGDGRLNVTSYKRAVSLEGTANRAFNLPPGFPDAPTSGVVSASDAASQSARGLLEAVVAADLPADILRQALVDHHVAVRAGARQTITFDPVNDLSGDRLPRLRVDYDAGDVVPFRASVNRPTETGQLELDKRIDVLVRIYQITVAVDERGVGQPTLTVTPT